MSQQGGASVVEVPVRVQGRVSHAERMMETNTKDACNGNCDDKTCSCERERKFAELDAATCPKKFGHISKKFLMSNPRLIGKLIARAQRFLGHPGGETLLSKLRGIRHMHIDRMSQDERERTLKRAFRRSGATLEPVLT